MRAGWGSSSGTLSPFPTQTNDMIDLVDKGDAKEAREKEEGCQGPKCWFEEQTPHQGFSDAIRKQLNQGQRFPKDQNPCRELGGGG